MLELLRAYGEALGFKIYGDSAQYAEGNTFEVHARPWNLRVLKIALLKQECVGSVAEGWKALKECYADMVERSLGDIWC